MICNTSIGKPAENSISSKMRRVSYLWLSIICNPDARSCRVRSRHYKTREESTSNRMILNRSRVGTNYRNSSMATKSKSNSCNSKWVHLVCKKWGTRQCGNRCRRIWGSSANSSTSKKSKLKNWFNPRKNLSSSRKKGRWNWIINTEKSIT